MPNGPSGRKANVRAVIHRRLFLLGALPLRSLTTAHADKPPRKAVFIGNSYTWTAIWRLKQGQRMALDHAQPRGTSRSLSRRLPTFPCAENRTFPSRIPDEEQPTPRVQPVRLSRLGQFPTGPFCEDQWCIARNRGSDILFPRLEWPVRLARFRSTGARQAAATALVMTAVSFLTISQGLGDGAQKSVAQHFNRWNSKGHGRLFLAKGHSSYRRNCAAVRSYFGKSCGTLNLGKARRIIGGYPTIRLDFHCPLVQTHGRAQAGSASLNFRLSPSSPTNFIPP